MSKIKFSKKVLLISQYFKPDITAAAFRMADLYKNLSNKDSIEVDVITTYPHKSEDIQNYDYTQENNISRIKVPRIKGSKFLKYIIEYFYFVFAAIFRGLFSSSKKHDYIFITSPPLFVFITGYILAKLKRAQLIVDIRDIWPDTAVAAGMIEKNSLLYKLARKLEFFTYRHADYIFCVSKPMKNYIEKHAETEVDIIYNGISSQDIFNINQDKVNLSNNESKKIFYAGNVGFLQDIGTLLKTFSKNKGLQEIYEFYIIGGGAEEKKLKKYVEKNKLKNVYFIGQLSKEKTMKKLNKEADVLFLHLKDNEILKRTIPSKVFDYLLLNKPIIYGIDGEGREILDNLNCGVGFECEEINSLREALYSLDENFNFYSKSAKGNLNFVTNNFNRVELFDKVARKMLD